MRKLIDLVSTPLALEIVVHLHGHPDLTDLDSEQETATVVTAVRTLRAAGLVHEATVDRPHQPMSLTVRDEPMSLTVRGRRFHDAFLEFEESGFLDD